MKSLQVLLAVKALVVAALPGAEVAGFDGDASVLEVIPDGGMVTGFPGDPGDPQIDLSPPSYNYEHAIVIELSARGGAGGLSLDDMLVAIGAGVRSDRYLGGLCSWLEVTAPVREDRSSEEVTINWAECSIVAHYSTEDPLA